MFKVYRLNHLSKSFRILLLFTLLATSFLASPVLAQDNQPIITLERLRGNGIGIKIVFPENAGANLSIFLNTNKMDCDLVSPDTLYCIGRLRQNQTVLLTFYDTVNEEVTYTTTVTGPESIESIPEIICSIGQSDGGYKLASPSIGSLWRALFGAWHCNGNPIT